MQCGWDRTSDSYPVLSPRLGNSGLFVPATCRHRNCVWSWIHRTCDWCDRLLPAVGSLRCENMLDSPVAEKREKDMTLGYM